MDKPTLKVQQLINVLLAMNPRAEVFLHMEGGELRPLVDEDIEEIYAPLHAAKTAVYIGVPADTAARVEEEAP
ncbi:hypothetical protein MKX42_32750 [Paenibacillus sp. FSL R7-0204]|uniref:Geranylgeranyl pyrophosphate synthase n=1 Tax=Paenibacillus silagei TaxID=1670801 RepID=A0ABS4NWW8_9BACL|nr:MULTISPECIES: hypothetical protein [Paenibacillus]ETT75997.1 hypothetical protein C173_07347 [Paenibacillus sp. FSL R7-277]MBP2113934.1 geranylgeranyl pyrophosphate synthase [Paenibacillus silagei]